MLPQNVDLTEMPVPDLLTLERLIVSELHRRNLVRTQNKPLGDIAEAVVHKARGGTLEPNSTKSHDVTTLQSQRIQVKAMTQRRRGASSRFSQFRSLEFNTAVFLVFSADDFSITEAYETSADVVEREARYSAHTNARQPTLRQVRTLGVDITEEMQTAYEGIKVGVIES
ncbi:DUF6998 domain-containing protein [Nesterenkonia ebinurensis]|uniref:DUF6998 domain-containing protein n=1 Tax=Nesterenkonia ebinurensis TaxID=2608252 RepID=UPI00123E2C3D|nr:hypothetical protein [Nesterenkonia ebinurensis]